MLLELVGMQYDDSPKVVLRTDQSLCKKENHRADKPAEEIG